MNSRVTRLFKNGSNQAVRIPKEMAFETDEVRLYKDGNRLVIEPVLPKMGLQALLNGWQPLDEGLPEIEDLPPADTGIFNE